MHFLCFILLSMVHSSFELSYKKRVANLEEQNQQLMNQLSIIIQNFGSLNTSLTSILDNKRDSQDELLAIKQNYMYLEEQNKMLQDEVVVLQQKALEVKRPVEHYRTEICVIRCHLKYAQQQKKLTRRTKSAA